MYRSNSCIESCESGVVGDIEDINNKNKSYTFIDLSKKLNKISQQINKYYDSSSAYV
jgi:hypothetical protein